MAGNNKIVYDGSVLIDLTSDTVVQSAVLSGYTFHLKDGTIKTGSCSYDAYTSDATATAGEILATKTAYVNGSKVTGSMTNQGGISGTITSLSPYIVPSGYHDGSGQVAVDSTNIAAGNIKSGVVILGVEGTYTGSAITTQTKTVTPTSSQQVITADAGYDYLAQVTVQSVPYTSTLNSAGGYTITIL